MQVEDLYVQSIVQLTLHNPVHTHTTTFQSLKRATYANCVQYVRDISLK